MKKLLPLFQLLLSFFCLQAEAQVSFGRAEKLNDDWRFLRVDSAWNIFETPDMKNADYDDARWRHVTLPHDWGVELPMSPDKGSCQGYLPGGIGWYRRSLKAGTVWGASSRQYIYFEGVYNHSEVYLNGHLLGSRPSGFASFLYDLTPYLRQDGPNVLAVRVDHSQEADSRWYTGSGINRNVWLVTAPEVHLAQWGTAYRLVRIGSKKAELDVDIETTDERQDHSAMSLTAIVELTDAGGRVVARAKTPIGAQEKKTVRLSLSSPQRWTLSTPYLYTLTTRLSNGDESVVRVGLRTLQFSPEKGFALNGEWMKVKGVCVHDDAGVLGTAVPAEVWRRRIKELKAIGANAIRLSHNPHAPELYDICDEEGMLVMDEASDEWEFPKRKWLKGWNQGRPGFEGTYTYFEEWIERDVADMVRRDRCHPSIFLWSIGNEVDYPNDPYSHPVLDGDGTGFTQPMYGGYKPGQPNAERIGRIAQRLAAVVRSIDTSRPTTGALAGVVMSNQTAYPEAIDVVGYNYTESRYDEDHRQYPNRVIYGSENRHDLEAWKAVRDKEHIFGQFLWTGIDYLGESGVWPARGSSAGLLDLAGQRKPNGWYRAALWSEQPVCYIGTYPAGGQRGGGARRRNGGYVSPYAADTWNYREGDRVRVVCYTNAASARLLLNGQPVDGQMQRDEQTGILYQDVDYASGVLRCEADNGASYEVKTAGQPAALRLTTDGRMHVFVEVVDEQGNVVRNADNAVTVNVRGGRLLGLENGNIENNHSPRRAPDYRPQSHLRAYGGRLVAYVQPQGPTTVYATSPFLQAAEITLNAE
ncbi:MAG: glycoside hydrolase family 2 [Prevotella sp.]|nr:glycoside hydrolase family 2 [Prevotella sp.]